MKKFFLPMSVTAAAVTLFVAGCASSELSDDEIAAYRKKLNDFEKNAVEYKTHQKQKDKYVLPNASLETSRALYLPVGGAICDRAIALFGDSYVRLASQTLNTGNTKRWTTLKEEYAKGKESSAYKELLEQTAKFIEKNPPSMEEGAKYQKDPEALLDKVIQNFRVSDSYKFNNEYKKAEDDAAREKLLKEKEEKKLSAWYAFDGNAASPSKVYRDSEALKQEMLKKVEAEHKAAWEAALEAHAKTLAFIGYWSAVLGKKLYPVIVPMVPAPAPVNVLLANSAPLANKVFDEAINPLAKKYPFLPTSLDPDFSGAPNLQKLMGDGPVNIDTLLNKLSDKTFVESLIDKQLIEKVKDPKGYVMKNMNISNPFEIVQKVKEIKNEIAPVLDAMSGIQDDLDKKDYGAVALGSLGAIGNGAGRELVTLIANELNPYKYANDIAGKRIEFTAEGLKWLTEGTLEDLASSGAF